MVCVLPLWGRRVEGAARPAPQSATAACVTHPGAQPRVCPSVRGAGPIAGARASAAHGPSLPATRAGEGRSAARARERAGAPAGLAVGEDAHVEAVQGAGHERGHLVKHLAAGARGAAARRWSAEHVSGFRGFRRRQAHPPCGARRPTSVGWPPPPPSIQVKPSARAGACPASGPSTRSSSNSRQPAPPAAPAPAARSATAATATRSSSIARAAAAGVTPQRPAGPSAARAPASPASAAVRGRIRASTRMLPRSSTICGRGWGRGEWGVGLGRPESGPAAVAGEEKDAGGKARGGGGPRCKHPAQRSADKGGWRWPLAAARAWLWSLRRRSRSALQRAATASACAAASSRSDKRRASKLASASSSAALDASAAACRSCAGGWAEARRGVQQ
jgi:hypothetical protein